MDLILKFEGVLILSVIAYLTYAWLIKPVTVRVKLGVGACMPKYMTEGAAGFDFYANLPRDLRMAPGKVYAVPTGLKVAVPRGYELQVRSRSGLAKKHSVVVANSPGTIDSDYRGEVFVLLANNGPDDFLIKHGERIAQGVVAPCARAQLQCVTTLDETDRNAGGFGSTGI